MGRQGVRERERGGRSWPGARKEYIKTSSSGRSGGFASGPGIFILVVINPLTSDEANVCEARIIQGSNGNPSGTGSVFVRTPTIKSSRMCKKKPKPKIIIIENRLRPRRIRKYRDKCRGRPPFVGEK